MGLQALWRLVAVSYYRWALREMDPQHPDLPHVMLRMRELQDAAWQPSYTPTTEKNGKQMNERTDSKGRKLAGVLASLVLVAAAGLAHGQVAGSTVVATAAFQVRDVATGWSVGRQVLGKPVVNEREEAIGRVEDIILAPDASISYVIVGSGGFLGLRRHDVAIPISRFAISDDKLMLEGAERELLKQLPAFEYAR